MALIVNLFAGPGAAKSTMAADIFAKLKWSGVNCELATEYAKDKVWEKSFAVLDNQIYLFGKQHHKLFRLNDQVDVVVTDSPILFSIIYDAKKRSTLKQLVIEEFMKFDNYNVFIERKKKYNPSGRIQTEEQARDKDIEVLNLLDEMNKEHGMIWDKAVGTPDGVKWISERVLKRLSLTGKL